MADLDGSSAAASCNDDSGGAPDPGTAGAPSDARYWVGSAATGLSAEHNLGALATGLVKNTAGTPSIAIAGTDYQAPLADVITADTYSNPDAITVTQFGIVTAVAGGSPKALQATQVIAGAGLIGGGTLAANRTLNVAAADGTITVNADSIQVGQLVAANIAGTQTDGFVATLVAGTPTWQAAAVQGYTTVENNGSAVTQRSTLNLSTEFTATDTASKTALALTTNGVAYSKLAQAAGLSVLGVTGSSLADLAAITGTASQVLRVNGTGTSLAFGLLGNANIDPAAAIDITKLGNLAGNSVLGRAAAGTGAMAAITGTTIGHVLTVQGDGTLAFSAASASGYATIERPNGTPLTQRSIMSFTTEFTVADNTDTTDISLATAGVGFSKLADLTAVSVLGRSAGTDGVMAAISASTNDCVLRRTGGGVLGFGALTNAHLSGFTDTQVILGNSSGTIAGSAALLYDSSRRFVSTGADIGLRQTGATSTDTRFMVEDFGVRIVDETIDLVSLTFQGSATTGKITYEARSGTYVTGAAEYWVAPDNGSPSMIIGRSDKGVRLHQTSNFAMGFASHGISAGGGVGVFSMGNAFTVPASAPTAGFVMYSASGQPSFIDDDGVTTTL